MAMMPIAITDDIARFGTYLGSLTSFFGSTSCLLVDIFLLLSIDDKENMQQTDVSSRKTATDDETPTDASDIVATTSHKCTFTPAKFLNVTLAVKLTECESDVVYRCSYYTSSGALHGEQLGHVMSRPP